MINLNLYSVFCFRGRRLRQIESNTTSSDGKKAIYECILAAKNFDFQLLVNMYTVCLQLNSFWQTFFKLHFESWIHSSNREELKTLNHKKQMPQYYNNYWNIWNYKHLMKPHRIYMKPQESYVSILKLLLKHMKSL